MFTEQCSGRKYSKIRITGLAAADAVSDKLPMFLLLVKQKAQGVLRTLRNFLVGKSITDKELDG